MKTFLSKLINPKAQKISLDNRNKNILAVGGDRVRGCDHARDFVDWRIAQGENSIVIVDNDGSLYSKHKDVLTSRGYTVKYLNFANPKESNVVYDPFAYVKNEKDATLFADILLPPEEDSFFRKNSEVLLRDCVLYMNCGMLAYERSVDALLNLLDDMKTDKNAVFERFKSVSDAYLTLDQDIALLTQLPERMLCGIVDMLKGNVSAVMSVLNDSLDDDDTVHFASFGTEKTALFIVPDPNFLDNPSLEALIYAQCYNVLMERAEANGDFEPPLYHTEFVIPWKRLFYWIPKIEQKTMVCRKYDISFSVFFTSATGFTLFPREDSLIPAHCDTKIIFDGCDDKTLLWAKKLLGAKYEKMLDNLSCDTFIRLVRGYAPELERRKK